MKKVNTPTTRTAHYQMHPYNGSQKKNSHLRIVVIFSLNIRREIIFRTQVRSSALTFFIFFRLFLTVLHRFFLRKTFQLPRMTYIATTTFIHLASPSGGMCQSPEGEHFTLIPFSLLPPLPVTQIAHAGVHLWCM